LQGDTRTRETSKPTMADFHFEGVEKLLEVSFFFAQTYLPKKAWVWLGFSIIWVFGFGFWF